MAGKIISFINLKGGVGKTTLALCVGEFLAFVGLDRSRRQRVLMVDMDSQSNLSYALVSQDKLRRLWDEGKTTYHLFQKALQGDVRDIDQAILTDCSSIERTQDSCLHVLVSSPDLGNFDEELLEMLGKGNKPPIDLRLLLKQTLDPLRNEYDFIIVDCPPSLSTFISSAVVASDYYVVPIVPEKLSVLGLELVQTRITGLKDRYPEEVSIEFAGSILNKVDITRKDHRDTFARQIYEDEVDKFHPFHWWVADIKPLYLASDYQRPFELNARGKRGRWWQSGLAWRSFEEKYTDGTRGGRANPRGILRRDDDCDYYSGSKYNIADRLGSLALEVAERCA